MNRRAPLLVVLLLALAGGCADLVGVQSLSGGDGGVDAGVLDSAIDRATTDGPAGSEASSCHPTWVAASGGVIPPGAMSDGPLDASFVDYVCRVTVGGAVLPGKLVSPWGCYWADDEGGESLAMSYEALVPTGCVPSWIPAPAGVTSVQALVCGQDPDGGALYSCQSVQGTAPTANLGRMGWSTNHQCLYTVGGQQLTSSTFDVVAVQ